MLNVNTIEFNGRKAVINSYSDHPSLVESMNIQRMGWMARYPNATVRTERMTEADTVALVAPTLTREYHLRSLAHEIGKESEA